MSLRVYIGYDQREGVAYDVAERTAQRFGCDVTPIYEDRLRASGLLTRPVDRRAQLWDFNSSAPQSTEFAISRFLVPLLAHAGAALYTDCDVVFLRDPHELFTRLDPGKAVHVVQHPDQPASGTKMDGQPQLPYPRKLWSSVVLWNLEHPATKRVNLTMLNQWPGRDLHAFGWLADDEIGALPPEANWLVGLQPKPADPMIAHFTLGTPDMPGKADQEHAALWWNAAR